MNIGWLAALFAGMLAGSFVIPSKKIKRLRWDQTWLVYCVVSLVILPISLAVVFAPRLFEEVFARDLRMVLIVAGCGAMWGLGAFLFARAIVRLGFSLANAIVCGVVILVGSASPLLVGAASLGPGESGKLIAGLAVLIAGIAICAWASILRDRNVGVNGAAAPSLTASIAGLGLALLSGVISSMLNTGFAYGGVLVNRAADLGISELPASLAVWVPVLFGGFLANLAATGVKISRAKDWKNYGEAIPTDWLRAMSLGVIWFGAVLMYGLGSSLMGEAGPVYGWALYMGMAILTSTAWGFITGEWKQAGRVARIWVIVGVGLFILAFGILATKGQPAPEAASAPTDSVARPETGHRRILS